MSKFKTKQEYEAEDSARHRKRLEDVRRKQDEKWARGFDCPFEGCSEHFDSPAELNEHKRIHQNQYKRDMKCTKPQCKDIKVTFKSDLLITMILILVVQFVSRREFNKHIDEHKEETIKKMKKHLRSLLLLNKHGILLDEVRLGECRTFWDFISSYCNIVAPAGVQESRWKSSPLFITWLLFCP